MEPGLLRALASAYANLLKRQRTAASAFVRWATANARSNEFSWCSQGIESFFQFNKELAVESDDPGYASVKKMMATAELNPYEREIRYGYPFIVGYAEGTAVRAPIFSVTVTIRSDGDRLIITSTDEPLRFNSLPFRSELDTASHELALRKLIETTPELPLTAESLRLFCRRLELDFGLSNPSGLDFQIGKPPLEPKSKQPLTITDNSAFFVAPKTSYFLVSDLEEISENGSEQVTTTALGWMIGKRPKEETSDTFDVNYNVIFPFSSNPRQRRVAQLADEPNKNRIIVVQGPPGTGKSLTIANVACHLVANGKRVLISSQKDKALSVVDELLRKLDMAQLPMTLLHYDRDSKRELRERLTDIQKNRPAAITLTELARSQRDLEGIRSSYDDFQKRLAEALIGEHQLEHSDRMVREAAHVISRTLRHCKRQVVAARLAARVPRDTRQLAGLASEARQKLLDLGAAVLKVAAEHRVGEATRTERNHLREVAKVLGRDQGNQKNFAVFDRLKKDPERCRMLLKVLPCWIMSPDDVARLFPCEAGLFDTVIIDEASQCDLPSMAPVLFRAKQAIIAGDSKQMQAQRFAFTAHQVAVQAWHQQGMDTYDPDGWLDPARVDLLQLAQIRMDEEVFLDEHYRSVPSIITFSNHKWYGDQLRLMRDEKSKRFGHPDSPAISLHHVASGRVETGSQRNMAEAEEVVRVLERQLYDPGYSDASFGVICLFEEQMRLVSDLVAERIDPEVRQAHQLVVVNPDGFQGDERDVVYYSLSYDAKGMSKEALSARQADREHIQGMLNVAFTRAREEMQIFHSAEIGEFGMASGRGVIKDWLEHCSAFSSTTARVDPLNKTQSEFEAEVVRALNERGIATETQYPCCGYFIDIVAEADSRRVAIECDGEIWHLDEHGKLKAEDLYRQEILERAGWNVLRIPYRRWKKAPEAEIAHILDVLSHNTAAYAV